MKIQYKVQSLYLVIGVTHTTRNYSINEEKITTLLEITRVPSNFLLPYPTLLGFEKPLLVIAWLVLSRYLHQPESHQLSLQQPLG